ncbi:MAG TPA: PEP-CTERM sorting domain-containing protein [Edaphobacter sp.]|nr:PEP-CTERM sorting domain-containing protein [Edaphobacter sp.]
MKKTRVLLAIPCLVAFLAVTGAPAHADITSAVVYQNVPNPGNAGSSANWASTLPSASFTIGASGIDFTSPPSAYTTAAFLNNPTFSNQVNGFDPNGTADNIELVIDGSLYLNAGANSFVVGHDDGAVLSIAGFGNVVDAPGPTAYSSSPFTVNAATAGMYNFHLEYAECCGGPSDLVFRVNDAPIGASTPEPTSFILLGSGLLGFAGVVRRRIGL